MGEIIRIMEDAGYKHYHGWTFERGDFAYTVEKYTLMYYCINHYSVYTITLKKEDKITRIFYDTLQETFNTML